MEKELREIIESKIQVLSEKKSKDGSMTILAPWIMTGQRNRNGRLYSLPLIQREVAKFQDRIKSGSVIGSADHPGGAFTTLSDASHIITKLSLDKNGQGWMEAKLLPTSKGKNVIEIIKAGGQLGISARGAGTVLSNGVVGDDYKLLGIDIVTNPSEPTATFDKSNIFESANFNEDEKMKNLLGLSQEYVDETMKDCYEIYQKEENFKGTFSDFEKQMGNAFLAEILVAEGKCANTETALKHLGVKKSFEKIIDAIDNDKEAYLGALKTGFQHSDQEFEALELLSEKTSNQKLTEEAINAKIMSFFNEAVSGGFRGTISEFKEKFPAIVESASEVKIVTEKKAEPRVPFKSKCSWAEIQLSGFVGTIAEYEEKYPDIEVMKPETQKPIVEKTLEQEAAIIFTGLSQDNPNSQITLEDVKRMLEKEEIVKADKRLRKKAIAIVARDLDGSLNQEQINKMVEIEIERLKEQRQEMREKNWAAYRRLLSD
jgi:hypothetical protein